MRSLIAALTVCLAPAAFAKPPASFHDLSAKTLEGKAQALAAYKGKVVVVVNTASECGYTPQYEGLQKLSEAYAERGVVVLGFPSNDFGGQEPGTAPEIKKFCELRYKVKFPMFEKVVTKGDGQSPVYAFLVAKHGEPEWNFHKYVVGKDGQVKAALPSSAKPQGPELQAALEKALKEELKE